MTRPVLNHSSLKEASEQFDAVIHGYCLMANHYHLLIETPKANLSRIMRHINGVYTQRFNRLRKVDGPLFRGRYKAILVDKDAYLLQLSRYIHRNPIEIKRPAVSDLEDYPWSSYPAYVNKVSAPRWLYREKTYQMLGTKQRYKGYQVFVAKGIDEGIRRYYHKGNIRSVLGSKEFRASVKEEFEEIELDKLRIALQDKPDPHEIIQLVSKITGVDANIIRLNQTGKRESNPARAFAMYACQYYGGRSLKEIASTFQLSHPGSASFSINKTKKEIALGEWKKEINHVEHGLYIVK